jgi:predicted lipoprotein with Yx(FWY)xxD motif
MPQLATVSGGQAYVSAANQHTLYTFGADAANVSNCSAASGCTGLWPPYAAPAGTTAPSGTGFGIITRSDGSLQWTYQSRPLYNYAGDSGADQGNGQGINSFGGVWGIARPAAAGTPGPTSPPSGCVGYYC